MRADPIEALENAVAHHREEMAPTLVARHATSTWLRRAVTVALGVGVIALGLEVGRWSSGPDIEGALATAATVVTWIVGISFLARMTQVARRTIASATLRSFERTQGVGALGAATSVGVSAFLTPAQKILQQQEVAAERKRARARAKGSDADRDAKDFDDA